MIPVTARFELIAHRGNAAEFPENTLPAVRSALALGVDAVALDVQLSRDAVPFALHDAELLRTCDRPGLVCNLPAHELLAVEAAERHRFSDRHAGVMLPPLANLDSMLAPHPSVRVYLNLQAASLERFGAERVLDAVLGAMRGCRERLVLLSTDLAVVTLVRRRARLRTGWVIPAWDTHTQLKCEALAPDYVVVDQRRLPPRTALWRGPWQWVAYDVATLPEALVLQTRGIGRLLTMRVRAMGRELGLGDSRAARSAEGRR